MNFVNIIVYFDSKDFSYFLFLFFFQKFLHRSKKQLITGSNEKKINNHCLPHQLN